MEDKFYQDDFEKFLESQVKHHKMFPSDKIWRNIHSSIHPDYKWPALTIAAFAFLVATIAVSIYFSPGPNIFAVENHSAKNPGTNTSDKTGTAILSSTYPSQKSFAKTNSAAPQFNVSVPNQPFDTQESQLDQQEKHTTEGLISSNNSLFEPNSDNTVLENAEVTNSAPSTPRFINGEIAKELSKASALNLLPQKLSSSDNKAFAVPAKKSSQNNRWDYSVYITPSAGFRKLEEDKSATIKQSFNVGGPVAVNYISDVNDVVRHKPGTGMEAGFTVGYQLGKKITVRSGLQLNARQYNIEAFLSTTDLATIAFIAGNGVDSMTAYSSYRTSSGYEATQLQNRYYQVSIPIALEYEVAGNKHVQLNVAAGVQPTYMISENVYLISSDFRNYVENPEMSRKWNVNANVETFLSIKSGTYKWRVGPQFRYQLRPTSVNKYPIREYLMDYGLKVGVTKSIK